MGGVGGGGVSNRVASSKKAAIWDSGKPSVPSPNTADGLGAAVSKARRTAYTAVFDNADGTDTAQEFRNTLREAVTTAR